VLMTSWARGPSSVSLLQVARTHPLLQWQAALAASVPRVGERDPPAGAVRGTPRRRGPCPCGASGFGGATGTLSQLAWLYL
jgi:hypothetical protein